MYVLCQEKSSTIFIDGKMKKEQKHLNLPSGLVKQIAQSGAAKNYTDFTAKVIRLLEIALENEMQPIVKKQKGKKMPEPGSQQSASG